MTDVDAINPVVRSLADYRNDTHGAMRTRWSFQVTGDRISRIEAGQA